MASQKYDLKLRTILYYCKFQEKRQLTEDEMDRLKNQERKERVMVERQVFLLRLFSVKKLKRIRTHENCKFRNDSTKS